MLLKRETIQITDVVTKSATELTSKYINLSTWRHAVLH